MLSCVGDHILQEFTTDKIQNQQNCFTPAKKNLGEEGPQTD